ncbi:hypothetical protein DAI22_10g086800 [Oryza sativa Japonica Group]|nr:hypothetical protein DAI22_10g086800 [Oryza sativa Japonica Group]
MCSLRRRPSHQFIVSLPGLGWWLDASHHLLRRPRPLNNGDPGPGRQLVNTNPCRYQATMQGCRRWFQCAAGYEHSRQNSFTSSFWVLAHTKCKACKAGTAHQNKHLGYGLMAHFAMNLLACKLGPLVHR